MPEQPRPSPSVGLTGETALEPYLRAIRAHRLVFAVVVLATVAASATWLAIRAPRYEATTEMLVSPLPSTDRAFITLPLPRAVGESDRAVQTAAAIAESQRAAELAAKRVTPPTTTGVVEAAVDVAPREDTNVLEVSARAATGERAAQLADEYALAVTDTRRRQLKPLVRAAIDRTQDQLNTLSNPHSDAAEFLRARLAGLRSISDGTDPTLSVAEPAAVPSSPEGAPAWLVLIAAVVGGLAIGAVTAILIELLVPQRIHHEADVVSAVPHPVLARVPRGREDRLLRARTFADLPRGAGHAFRGLRTQLELRAASGRGPGSLVVGVGGVSGADGATTTAVNLARAAAAAGQRTVLVDFDLRGPVAADRLDVRPVGDMSLLLDPRRAPRDAATPVPAVPNLSLIAAPAGLDFAGVERLSLAAKRVLDAARSLAGWVVVDVSPLGVSADALPVAAAVDGMVLVSRIGATRSEDLATARDLLDRLGVAVFGHVIIGAATSSATALPSTDGHAPAGAGRPRTPAGAR